MFSIFMKEKIAAIGMLICFAISILLRVLLAILYLKMIRETDNMATTNNKLLKQCKLKFSNCYQLNNGVPNVQVFVEKFMNKLALGPFSFRLLYHLSGQLLLLSIVFSGVGVCRSIVAGSMFGEILPFYIVSLLELYLYFSITTLLDIQGKRKFLKVNLIDYLENHLSYRMQVTREDLQMLYGTEAREIAKGVELMPIAGWLANKGGRTGEAAVLTSQESGADAILLQQTGREQGDQESMLWSQGKGKGMTRTAEKVATIAHSQNPAESALPPLDPEESEELELLLKEILTLS